MAAEQAPLQPHVVVKGRKLSTQDRVRLDSLTRSLAEGGDFAVKAAEREQKRQERDAEIVRLSRPKTSSAD